MDLGLKGITVPRSAEQHVASDTPAAKDSIRKAREFGATSQKGKLLVWLRRASQAFFLALFLVLLVKTEYVPDFDALGAEAVGAEPKLGLDMPVNIFLSIDPLVGLSTALAAQSLFKGLVWCLVLAIPTLLVGRFFCGWICPFGTLHHWTAALWPDITGGKRIKRNRQGSYMRIKFYILSAMLVASLFTTVQIGLLDPICLMVRSVGLAIIPAVNYGAGHALDALALSNVGFLQSFADWGHSVRASSLSQDQAIYNGAFFLGLMFVGLVGMNRFVTRLWCRMLCPLGALLGVFAKFSIFGMRKDHEKCTGCNLCLLNCQGAAEPQGGEQWNATECHLCFNCEGACPEDVIHFEFFPRRSDVSTSTNMERRTFLAATGAGAAMLPLSRVSTGFFENNNPKLIRPPGSVNEKEFLERCIKCGECMKVCPTNFLHPAAFEAGLEGLWTPIAIARVGYCEHSCTLCGSVCPTGAIQPIIEAQKTGTNGHEAIRLGTAFYNLGRCLPWSMDTPCIVCEEWCPTTPKAIWVEEVEVLKERKEGAELIKLQRPHVDPERCIGCGACEYACPVKDEPAVYITNINESRNPDNRLLLKVIPQY
jgi:polyferredoxin